MLPEGRLHPLEFGEILDQAVKLFRNNWRLLLLITFAEVAPQVLGQLLALVLAGGRALEFAAQRPSGQDFLLQTFRGGGGVELLDPPVPWLFTIIGIILIPLVRGALITVCAHAHLGKPVDARTAFAVARQCYWNLFGTNLLVGLIIFVPAFVLGLLALNAPFLVLPLIAVGVVVALVHWVFVDHVVVLEQDGGGAALARSAALVKGRFWMLLALGAIFGLAGYLVQVGVDLTLGLLHSMLLHSLFSVALVAAGKFAAAMVVSAVTCAGKTLAYYDTRIRKEGLDLQLAANAGDQLRI